MSSQLVPASEASDAKGSDSLDAGKPAPFRPRWKLGAVCLHESIHLLNSIDELASAVTQSPNTPTSNISNRDPPADEMTHANDFWLGLYATEAGTIQPFGYCANSEETRLAAWDHLENLLAIYDMHCPVNGPVLLQPEFPPAPYRINQRVQKRLAARRILARVMGARIADPVLVAVVRFLVERLNAARDRDFHRRAARISNEYQSTAQFVLHDLEDYKRNATKLKLCSSVLPAVKIGPVVEQTAAAAVRQLAGLLENQLVAHFAVGQFLTVAGEVAIRGGLGYRWIGELVEVYLTDDRRVTAGISADWLAAVRIAAAEVHHAALGLWLRGLFVDWKPADLHNRLRLEITLLRNRGRRGVKTKLSTSPQQPGKQDRALKEADWQILEALAEKFPLTVLQCDLEAATGISRHTLSTRLKRVRDWGLVHRPQGERGGEAITDAGRDLLNRKPGTAEH